MTDRFDVIAAFADGEPVASTELNEALSDASGREYLVDILALRGLVDSRQMEPRRSRPVSIDPQVPSSLAAGRSGAGRGRWLMAVAALVVAGLGAGFIVGRQTAPAGPVAQATKIVLAPAAAPAPTHVIRMENGVNWNERAGGN